MDTVSAQNAEKFFESFGEKLDIDELADFIQDRYAEYGSPSPPYMHKVGKSYFLIFDDKSLLSLETDPKDPYQQGFIRAKTGNVESNETPFSQKVEAWLVHNNLGIRETWKTQQDALGCNELLYCTLLIMKRKIEYLETMQKNSNRRIKELEDRISGS